MTGQEALSLVDYLLQAAKVKKRLNSLQSTVFLETWQGRSYREIAEQLGYEYDYVKQVGSQLWKLISQVVGEEVSKQNLKAVLCRYQLSSKNRQDWGEAIDVTHFYGRHLELQILENWIIQDRCRVVGIFGLGGIGKTAFSVKLAQQVTPQFEYVIWRKLQPALTFNILLSEILPILSESTGTLEVSINALMKQLRQKRCLLVLDNIESILPEGTRKENYQDYQALLDLISDELYQSCLIITGREIPKSLKVREGKTLPVRLLKLQGLSTKEAEQILISKDLEATPLQCYHLVEYFGGNPLMLKLAATSIKHLFGGNIQAFLAQGNTIFSDLWDLLDHQFERLSPLEQHILYQIAIIQKAIIPAHLYEQILHVSWRELLEALESLIQRSWLETMDDGLIAQPVILEYLLKRFIQPVEQELLYK